MHWLTLNSAGITERLATYQKFNSHRTTDYLLLIFQGLYKNRKTMQQHQSDNEKMILIEEQAAFGRIYQFF